MPKVSEASVDLVILLEYEVHIGAKHLWNERGEDEREEKPRE